MVVSELLCTFAPINQGKGWKRIEYEESSI